MTLVANLLFSALAGATRASQHAQIDHIILGAPELESAMKTFEQQTGVRPLHGGVHPSLGTENALVSLGEGLYLEIIAPDPRGPNRSDVAKRLAALKHMTPAGWAVRTDNAAGLRAELEGAGFRPTALSAGSRRRPDGVKLNWTTFDLPGVDDLTTPFFIEWGNMRDHPSRTASAEDCRLESLGIQSARAKRLEQLVELLSLPVSVDEGAAPRIDIVLNCPRGVIRF